MVGTLDLDGFKIKGGVSFKKKDKKKKKKKWREQREK